MSTIEALEYECFDFSEPDARPLDLEEAICKAEELRKQDPQNFYRVEANDISGSTFVISKVTPIDLYQNMIARVHRSMQRYVRRTR